MLPNHAPLVIAEQFGTLESLYPGRIDLGLGRAPGSDQLTSRALRRGPAATARTSGPPRRAELLPAHFGLVHARQGNSREGLHVPVWLLGSSGFSAQLAGQLGLPFSLRATLPPIT